MLIDPTAVLIAVLFGFGVMALLAIAFGMVERVIRSHARRSVLHGLAFGCGAIVVMLEPVRLCDGVIFDARAIVVGLAAAFGGWPAALVAGGMAAAFRLFLGGLGAPPGAVGILLAAVLGLFWAWRMKPEGEVGLRALLGLGATVSLHAVSTALLPVPIFLEVVDTIVPALVLACVTGAVVMGSLVERERRNIRTEAYWHESANTDPLTKLPNRRWFLDAVGASLAERDAATMRALLVVDADHFKRINDRHGHAGGDVALVAIADRLRPVLRGGGYVGRLGGDEFGVFLPATTQATARRVADMLLSTIREARVVHRGSAIALSVSVGAVVRRTTSDATVAGLVEAADAALYAAKAGGRGRVAFAPTVGAEYEEAPAGGAGERAAPAPWEGELVR